jgi:hypothetical protein
VTSAGRGPGRVRRPDDETLRLALKIVEEVGGSPALAAGQGFGIEVRTTAETQSVTFTEPERRDLRDLLGLIRRFDTPSHDVRIDRLHEIVERVGVKPDWRDGLDAAKVAHAARNELTQIYVQDPDEAPNPSPTWIRPREGFELWLYGEVIHDDYAKQLRWDKLGALRQGLTRQMAHDYLNDLLRQAAFIRRLIAHGLLAPLIDDAASRERITGGLG